MFCTKCGQKLDQGMKFCKKCGKKVEFSISHTDQTIQNNIIPVKNSFLISLITIIYCAVSLIISLVLRGPFKRDVWGDEYIFSVIIQILISIVVFLIVFYLLSSKKEKIGLIAVITILVTIFILFFILIFFSENYLNTVDIESLKTLGIQSKYFNSLVFNIYGYMKNNSIIILFPILASFIICLITTFKEKNILNIITVIINIIILIIVIGITVFLITILKRYDVDRIMLLKYNIWGIEWDMNPFRGETNVHYFIKTMLYVLIISVLASSIIGLITTYKKIKPIKYFTVVLNIVVLTILIFYYIIPFNSYINNYKMMFW